MNVPDKGQSYAPDIPYHSISATGDEKQLLSLNPTKACGLDEQPCRLLTFVQELAPALTFLFSQSYTTGIAAMQWKQALVSGTFMKGSKSDPANH